MASFIKKAFEKNFDDLVHLQFQKFSKGEFKDRAVIHAKNIKGKFSVNTTAEFANELVMIMAEKLGNNKTKVTGVIVSTKDLSSEIDFQDKKQFMGIKQYVINKEMTGNEILALCKKMPTAFFALSFSANDSELFIKPKAPKSAKPNMKGEKSVKPDFCKLKTTDKNLIESMIFEDETKNFSTIEINHTFSIKDIILPSGEKDFAKIRELAKRKGTIIRKMVVDGKEIEKRYDFEA